MNRAAFDAIRLGMADGGQAVGERIVASANPPDAEPFGRGLVKAGRAVTYLDGRKVAGTGTAPRGAIPGGGQATVVGFGFPGRFQELGTVHHAAQPFLTPAIQGEAPNIDDRYAQGIRARLALVRTNATKE